MNALDVAIVGGGIAALWILDALDEAGYAVALFEPVALGQGQTLAAQGIIHGGLKYTLQGMLAPSAEAIREMPDRWRESLAGRRRPDLSRVRVASDATWLWRPSGVRGALSMLGARLALRSRPRESSVQERPDILRSQPATVYRVDEPVLDTHSLVACLRAAHLDRMTAAPGILARRAGAGYELESSDRRWHARRLLLAAGGANAGYREVLGLPSRMQRRPLRMGLLRGPADRPLPELYGHCVDRGATRVTITTHRSEAGSAVWQLGGGLAEEGVQRDPEAFLAFARDELSAVLPGLDLSAAEWAQYHVDRAELATTDRTRPDDAQCLVDEAGLITVWPTKLALAPRAAERVLEILLAVGALPSGPRSLDHRVPPPIGRPPWEDVAWSRLREESSR